MRVAIYSSVLYGEDFIEESIKSISNYVDKVYVILMDRPWGVSKGINYKGKWIEWPKKFDNTEEIVSKLGKVKVLKGYKYTPWCRHAYGAMMVLGKDKCKAKEILFIDPDCVFNKEEANKFFSIWESTPEINWAIPRQIEPWITTAYQILRDRPLISVHRGDLSVLPGTTHATISRLNAVCHNLGFCVSEKTMLWKHLTSMTFSDITGEAVPNPDWYEKVWLKWNYYDNNSNLEISLGNESTIPKAEWYRDVPLDPDIVDKIYQIRATDKGVISI